MKLLFTVLSGLVLCALGSDGFDYGPIDVHVQVGTLSAKYPVLSARDQRVSRNLRVIGEFSRRQFPYGLSNNLPVLEPYRKSKASPVVIEPESDSPLNGTIAISNLEVHGLQKFVLNNMELRLENGNNRTDFDLDFPLLQLTADFDANLQFINLPIHEMGSVSVNITRASIKGGTTASAEERPLGSPLPGPYFVISDASLDLHADDVQVDVGGVGFRSAGTSGSGQGSGSFTNDFQKALQEDVAKALVKTIQNEVNDVIGLFSVYQILALLDGI